MILIALIPPFSPPIIIRDYPMNPAQLIENRSTLLIFRDCLKLASRMVDHPVKTAAVRQLIKREFEKNRDVVDQE